MTLGPEVQGQEPIAPTSLKRKRRGSRLLVLLGILAAGIVVGAGIVSLTATVWVTPSVRLIGYPADVQNTSQSSNCNGWWPQVSFDGYFQCAVTITATGGGVFGVTVFNVSAPRASNVVAWPIPPVSVAGGASTTIEVSGQLGYSGSLVVYLQME